MKLRIFVFLLAALLAVMPALAQDQVPTLRVGESRLGPVLVGPTGLTLYAFTPDQLDQSNCYERCSEIWPPLLVPNADTLSMAEGVPGEIGVSERTTGTLQVTYNGMPLYYWYLDVAAGDTRGQAVGGVWWVVPPATVYIEQDDALGSILVGPTGRSLYLFTNDTPGTSNCYDQCAANWPPLLTESADAVVAGVNLPGELGTTGRTDGTLQVTYNGWPLYYWKDDVARGDTLGEARNDVWFTIVPETVAVSQNDALGSFLVAPTGRTLYQFADDTFGTSTCTGDCLQNWTPFTVAANDRLANPAGAEGELGTIAVEGRENVMQVTYNGVPLYTHRGDRAAGDTNGQGVDEKWTVVAP